MPDLLPKNSPPLSSDSSLPSSELLLRGDKVSLAEWLEVSWFYPEGFRKERVIETERSWIVLGNTIVYKFLKVPELHSAQRSREQFQARWRLACEEVLDNRALAPELYLGLRLLRWVDDEPQWISEKPSADLNPQRPPADADDVAIVMRRLNENGLLHRQLEDLEIGSERFTSAIGARLRMFHRGQRSSASPTIHDADGIMYALREQYLERLHQFILTDASYLDSFSQLALHEIRGYLGSYFAKNQALFYDRIKQQQICDGHGSLRADRICMNDTERGKALSIFGRLGRNDPSRFADELRDIAALSADIEARGFPQLATELEQSYFKGRTHDRTSELYRFYKVAEAVTRAQLLFRGKVDDSKVQGTSYLSLAFRLSLKIKGPFLVFLGGTAPEEEVLLAKDICELSSSVCLSIEDLPNRMSELDLPEELLLESLLDLAAEKLKQQQSVVFCWPLNREEERIHLASFAERRNIPYLLVQAEHGRSSRVSSEQENLKLPRRKILGNASSRYTKLPHGYAPQIIIEPMLAPADLALYVLKQIPAA
ncbi:MAG: hypothetical protein U0136_08575 [Bdellovibrionota bacterium]